MAVRQFLQRSHALAVARVALVTQIQLRVLTVVQVAAQVVTTSLLGRMRVEQQQQHLVWETMAAAVILQ
jgi:hypothetical protein